MATGGNMKNKKKTRSKPSMFLIGAAITVAASSYWAMSNLDDVAHVISKLKITGMSLVKAAETAASPGKKADETKGKKEEKSSSSKGLEKAEAPKEKKAWTEEEIKAFAKLEDRKHELDDREAEMARLEEELQQQKVMLEDKIKQLEKIRQNIGAVLKEKTVSDSEKVDRLVEFYSNMKPQNAAKVFEELNENLAVEVLTRIKKKNAADIMNLIKADKAQRLSEKFAGYRK
jgi:flagellar motility protein MotE (MotC chaperone)